jgi:hypothetical protein
MNALKQHPNEHLVSEGRVHCQKASRDVSVEVCWMCPRLTGFDVDDKREIVRCAPDWSLAELVPATP